MKKTILILLFLVIIAMAALNTASAAQSTERASIGDSEPNEPSYSNAITPDGRYIAFDSYASNLVSGDTNDMADVFVKDGWTGSVTRVSTTSTGAEANGDSYSPSITPNGRYIAFHSYASNLVSGDTNGESDVFVKDGWTGTLTRISTTSTGAQANGKSMYHSITPDGRYVIFNSDASNLISGDTNGHEDVFVKDGWTGTITRVSTSASGAQGDGDSWNPVITPDGRYIAFTSRATNLVAGDTNGCWDVFVKDGWTGQITRVSTTSSGGQAIEDDSNNAVITPDGRYVVFESAATNLVSGDINARMDIFVKDGWTGAITRVSTTSTGEQANGGSINPSITPDGRYIAFDSSATNLVSGDTNNYRDIFVKDSWTGAVTRVSVNSNGDLTNGDSWEPVITPDGRYIAYHSHASGIVTGDLNNASDIFVYDRLNSRNIRISTCNFIGSESNGGSIGASISSGGRYVAFESDASNLVPYDTNGFTDVFVHDKVTNRTIRVSTTSTGEQANWNSYSPVITPDGRYVAFNSYASNLISWDTNGVSDVFVKDMLTGVITRISTTSGNHEVTGGGSYNPKITPDGRYIAFESAATNLVSGDTNGRSDIFVKDGWYGTITRVNTAANGAQATGGNSLNAVITHDGRYVTFNSYATNLVAGDTNGFSDVFVKDGWTGAITRVNTAVNGAQATGGNSAYASITPDGRYIVFESYANNLVIWDTNGRSDIFVKDGWTGAITRVNTAANGAQADDYSNHPSITPDGRYIVFDSVATNLVSGDTNNYRDIFVKDGWTGQTTRVSTTATGGQADGNSSYPVITPDGRYVAFQSDANLLGYIFILPLDLNGVSDIYVKGLW